MLFPLPHKSIYFGDTTLGLFEVRYTDDNLDAKAAISLMEAISELKKLPVN
jgi:hypothetical protein